MATATLERGEKTYEKGLEDGRKRAEAKKGGEEKKNKGFITSLLDDLLETIQKSDEKKKEALTARNKVPTMETVVAAFDAANDVTSAVSEAYAMRATDEARAIEMQRKAEADFLSRDPLVLEGALLVLYMRAEAEYADAQQRAGYSHRSDYDLAA